MNVFSLTLIFSLFVGCFGINVFIRVTTPVQFKINQQKTLICIAENAIPPVTFQWALIQAGSNYTFPNSNHSQLEFKFSAPQTGYIICQAKGRSEVRFHNSTMVPFSVNPDVSGGKLVWIDTLWSPIIFRVNRTKILTCKTVGFINPISYQWVNVSSRTVFGVYTTPSVSFTFNQRIKNGYIQCLALDSGQTFYMPSAPVWYQVNGQMSHKINTFFLSFMMMFSLTFSAFQKIH